MLRPSAISSRDSVQRRMLRVRWAMGRMGILWLGVAVSTGAAWGQGLSTEQLPPGYRGVQTFVPGIFLTPAPNAPFSGDVEIVSHTKLPDGSDHVTTARNHLARASSGRIYQERHPLAPASMLGQTPVLSAHIYDPSSRQSLMVFPGMHLVRAVTLRAPEPIPVTALPPAQQPKTMGTVIMDLGRQEMNGLELQGIRKQRIVPAEMSGTGQPVTVTDDYWYSQVLQIYVTVRHDDPRTGEQLVVVTDIERTEPPATQFVPPPAYKVVDETPDETPAGSPLPTRVGSTH